jgi:arylsulfatase A-like enzyme
MLEPTFVKAPALLLSAIVACVTLTVAHGQTAPARPNIVVILADDMGFSDIGCYGSEIPTPNIDRLGQEGVRLSQFYNTSRCCPTRAALLTGLYSHQAGIGHMIDDYAAKAREKLNSPAYTTKLNERCVTIGEALGAAGYETMMSGKWHVGSQREAWPDKRGFARSFCVVGGAMNYFGSGVQHVAGEIRMQLALDGKPWEIPSEGFYATDAFTDHAVQFIRERKDPAKPFFLYLAYNAPHWPIQALPEDIAKYRGKYRAGFGDVRQARLDRQIALGLFPKNIALPERDPAVPAWADRTEEQRDEMDLRMAIYAAQMDRMDQGIGRLLTTLKDAGADENTLVMFLSDNGGCHEGIERGKPEATLGTRDSYSSYRRAWAQVSNTPFRFYKHWTHEGGIATPLVARWPAQIKAQEGFKPGIGHVIDILPTCLEAAGAKYPAELAGRKITPVEGRSLLPLLTKNEELPARTIYWEHEGNRAVREGRWKLVSAFPNPWELYDLQADRNEQKDLAGEMPDMVHDLSAKYDAWAAKCEVRPWELTKK